MAAHMKKRKPDGAEGGFTLLELLLSIVLVTAVVVIVSGALRLGYRSVASGEKKMESLERLRSTVTVLDAQIQSSVPLTEERDGSRVYYFRGEPSEMQLSTNHSLWGAEKGFVVAAWRVEKDSAGRSSLMLSEKLVGMERAREARLLDGLDEVSFAFFRKGQVGREGDWVDSWSDPTDLPRKIRIRMASGDWKMSLVIPMRSGGTMEPATFTPTRRRS